MITQEILLFSGSDESNDEHEPADEVAADSEDHAGVREAVGDHGHEGGNDERCHR